MGDVSAKGVASGSISAAPPNQPVAPGGNPSLWERLYSITTTVENTGAVAGAAVPQLYLDLPQPANEDVTPVKVLRGFDKVMLQPGQSQTITFDLTRRDISYWDIFTQQWMIGPGAIQVMVGFSSRDIQANTSFSPLGGGGYENRRHR